MTPGKMIVIEGIEGAGKSTSIDWVKTYLLEKGITYVSTREPGGTRLGESLRELLKKDDSEVIEPETELLLMYASRMQLFHRVIKEALAKGSWVVSDRFELSSYAYQGVGRHLGTKALNNISALCLKGFKPDLTLYMDVPYEVSQARLAQRGIEKDRIEQEGETFFNAIRDAYCKFALNDKTIVRIDASKSLEEVKKCVLLTMERLC